MNEEIKASVDSPAFRTEAEFAAYLDSLHETMPDGAVTNRKWGPAQRALAGLAASRAVLPVTDSRLLAFVDRLIDGAFDGGSFDGGDIQELATEHGLLQVQDMPEPCGEGCRCAQDVPFFPAQCYRKTYLAASPVAGWVSVEERLPEERGRYLVYQATFPEPIRIVNFGTSRGWENGRDKLSPPGRRITHWMPLPPAPVTPKQEQS